jgi:hypothetical protein
VNRKRLGRFAAVMTSVALLGAAALAAGPVAAKNPGWILTITKLPPSVSSGKDAGYRVYFENPGPSNINGMTVKSLRTEAPSYFSGLDTDVAGPTSCTYPTGQFSCVIGTMRAGEHVEFTIAYTTSGSGTFDVTIEIRSSSGDTGSDGGTGNHSRGDAKSITAKTGLSSSNFVGGYYPADTTVQTNQSLGNQNKQSSSLNGFNASSTNRYDIMVGESPTLPTDDTDPFDGLSCTIGACNSLKGEWTLLSVKEGETQGTAFHVQIRVLASLFGNPASTSDVDLVHLWLDDSNVLHQDVIGNDPGERCATAALPAGLVDPGCVYVSTTGNGANKIYIIDAWLFHNGSLRGGY